jgi:hypothetical protein
MENQGDGVTAILENEFTKFANRFGGQNIARVQTKSAIAAPMWIQYLVLVNRKLKLTWRDPGALLTPILVPCFAGVLTGVMFGGIGEKALMQQLPCMFLMLVRVVMSGMQLIPNVIEERNIMKYDISESLYSVLTFIVVGVAVDVTIALFGSCLSTTIMYALTGINWAYYPCVLGWSIINFFVFDAFFGFIAANSATVATAQVSAIPLNSIFMMFSGFMLSKASAPWYFKWIFEVSPLGYAMESIVLRMSKDYGLQGKMVVEQYGYEEGNELKGLTVMFLLMLFFRSLQLWALAYRHNIQK